MPKMTFDRVSKQFGKSLAISEFTVEIPDKEFLVLVGPSGCGKSTLLRMIAGLTDISEGEILFDGVSVTHKTPRERDVAFVFQSYALYPHMSVRQNIAFPLLVERMRWYHQIPLLGRLLKWRMARRGEVAGRVDEIAGLMRLSEYLNARPGALSGGQRQRVALARALVRQPSLYLFDEPLSNLDAKLRTQMRAELSELYRRTNKSFIYVTHDQVEAMTMGTVLIVLNDGEIQQVGRPEEVYEEPRNVFVAQFIGSPGMNLVNCTRRRDGLYISGLEGSELTDDPGSALAEGAQLFLGVRPESTRVLPLSVSEGARKGGTPSKDRGGVGSARGTVTGIERLGSEVIIAFTIDEVEGRAREVVGSDVGVEDGHVTHHARMKSSLGIEIGQACRVEFDLAAAAWFDADSGERVSSRPMKEPQPV